LQIPNKSRLFLDITNLGNCSVTGFQDTSISPVPFKASVDVDTAVIEASLRHQVGVGFQFIGSVASVELGVYLDLPQYRAEFAHVEGVDEKCKSLAFNQGVDREIAQRVLTDVYYVQPSVNWQMGIAGGASVSV